MSTDRCPFNSSSSNKKSPASLRAAAVAAIIIFITKLPQLNLAPYARALKRFAIQLPHHRAFDLVMAKSGVTHISWVVRRLLSRARGARVKRLPDRKWMPWSPRTLPSFLCACIYYTIIILWVSFAGRDATNKGFFLY